MKVIPKSIGRLHALNCSCGSSDSNSSTQNRGNPFGPAAARLSAHNSMAKAVAIFCDKLLPFGSIVKREFLLPFTGPDKTNLRDKPQLRADIYVLPTGETSPIILDIRTISPCGISCINSGSCTTPLKAAAMGADVKNKKYESYTINGVKHNILKNFIPFVVESSGALGKEATKFIAEITDNRSQYASDKDI
jgi:hypothetical protein